MTTTTALVSTVETLLADPESQDRVCAALQILDVTYARTPDADPALTALYGLIDLVETPDLRDDLIRSMARTASPCSCAWPRSATRTRTAWSRAAPSTSARSATSPASSTARTSCWPRTRARARGTAGSARAHPRHQPDPARALGGDLRSPPRRGRLCSHVYGRRPGARRRAALLRQLRRARQHAGSWFGIARQRDPPRPSVE